MYLLISIFVQTLMVFIGVILFNIKFDADGGTIILPYKVYRLGIMPIVILYSVLFVQIFFNIAAFISLSLLSIRRLHDLNCSGIGYWIWLTSLIAFCLNTSGIFSGLLLYFIIGAIIALAITPGYKQENKYGLPEPIETSLKYTHSNG
jgi:uncharacterized membrane protein YhaH (DUF805 family)